MRAGDLLVSFIHCIFAAAKATMRLHNPKSLDPKHKFEDSDVTHQAVFTDAERKRIIEDYKRVVAEAQAEADAQAQAQAEAQNANASKKA